MQNIAQVYLDGNLTADPETKTTPGNRQVTGFRVAANHEWSRNKGDDEKFVSYFTVECWERLAENCGRYLRKGDHVTLIGDLRQDRWQDSEGRSRSTIKIVARYVRFDSVRAKSAESQTKPTRATTEDRVAQATPAAA